MFNELIEHQIQIHLHDSRNANIFKPGSAIHEREIKAALVLVEELLLDIESEENSKEEREKNNERPPGSEPFHQHNTISIFGRRGSGKTSFLLTLLCKIRNESKCKNKVYVMCPIDPNLIEGPEIFLATVVAKIHEHICHKFKNDCIPHDISEKLLDLASAFRVLAPTNNKGEWGKWLGNISDQEVFAREVLSDAQSGVKLASRVNDYVSACCKALDVKAIVLPFDDVDTDLKYGWHVLETVRRYLATPKLITIISGDLTLYRMLVRSKQWKILKDLANYEEHRTEEFKSQINQLEEQYLKKLLPSQKRIQLGSLNEQIFWKARQGKDLVERWRTSRRRGIAYVEQCLPAVLQRCLFSYHFNFPNQNPEPERFQCGKASALQYPKPAAFPRESQALGTGKPGRDWRGGNDRPAHGGGLHIQSRSNRAWYQL